MVQDGGFGKDFQCLISEEINVANSVYPRGWDMHLQRWQFGI